MHQEEPCKVAAVIDPGEAAEMVAASGGSPAPRANLSDGYIPPDNSYRDILCAASSFTAGCGPEFELNLNIDPSEIGEID
jgi:hypothetical protein